MLRGYYPEHARVGVFKGIDLRLLARRLWRFPAMQSQGLPLPAFTWRAKLRGYTGGSAYGRRIVIRLGPSSSLEYVAQVLAHELVHCALPAGVHHGEDFCRRLIELHREFYKIDLSTDKLLALPMGKHKVTAYAIDEEITIAMKARGVAEWFYADVELCGLEDV